MRTLALLLLTLGHLPFSRGGAQVLIQLAPETHVKYWQAAISTPVEAEVMLQQGDSLWVRSLRTGDTLAVVLSSLARLEVDRGPDTHGVLGAQIGSAVGGVVGGFGLGAGSRRPRTYQKSVVSALAVAIFGGGLGALIGERVHTPHWEPVALAPAPQP